MNSREGEKVSMRRVGDCCLWISFKSADAVSKLHMPRCCKTIARMKRVLVTFDGLALFLANPTLNGTSMP